MMRSYFNANQIPEMDVILYFGFIYRLGLGLVSVLNSRLTAEPKSARGPNSSKLVPMSSKFQGPRIAISFNVILDAHASAGVEATASAR